MAICICIIYNYVYIYKYMYSYVCMCMHVNIYKLKQVPCAHFTTKRNKTKLNFEFDRIKTKYR